MSPTSTTGTDSDDTTSAPDSTSDASPSKFRKYGTRALIVVAASSTLVWLGAIAYGTFGDYHLTGWLEDRQFPEAAEKICKPAMEDVADFPPARTAKTPADRAVVIRASTARLQQMLDDLRAVVPDTKDAKYINLWIDDWGVHLADRLDFARRLDKFGADQEFFETPKANTQISKSLNHFAEVNQMESCTTPGDV